VTLSFADAIDSLLAVPPSERTFGPGETSPGAVQKGQVRVRVGERPIVRNLKTLYRKTGRAMPADLQLYSAYNVWLVVFYVGALRESGVRALSRFGFAVTFPEKPRVTVLNLVPQSRFVKRVGLEVTSEAALSLNGEAHVPDAVAGLLAETDVLSGTAKLRIGTDARVVGTLSLSVMTPVVTAIGVGGRAAEWLFERDEKPLVGDQHMAVTLLVPKSVEELQATTRLSATVSVFDMLPCTLATEMTLQIPLES
jgi:hypothetical protein